ncbi:hypothetical protein KQX54_020957 [Cotesia glomerata]|uniref:Odorant receptor n=1 Tax=Cotesia glomerata TaxID=32391 RepID=A0AAV7IK64_COTGL|nr:hypothetical protein KQX54_020957 [Cotesia glomerata]
MWRYWSRAFLVVTESVLVTTVSTSIVNDPPNRGMFYDTYLPCDSSTIGYWTSYVFQIIAHVFGSLVNVAYDTLIPGLILKICAQLSILEHRLDLVSKDVDPYGQLTKAKKEKSNKVTECVKHHLQILQLDARTNKVFSVVMHL